MTDLVFLDVETTGLDTDSDIWEFAAIRRTPRGEETTTLIQIDHDVSKVARLPESFRADLRARFDRSTARRQPIAASIINATLAPRGGEPVHIVGANIAFDAAMISRLFRRNGILDVPWHYHLIDVEAMALGYLAARGNVVDKPWHAYDLALQCGLTTSDDHVQHTALGDTLWARDWYDAMTRITVAGGRP